MRAHTNKYQILFARVYNRTCVYVCVWCLFLIFNTLICTTVVNIRTVHANYFCFFFLYQNGYYLKYWNGQGELWQKRERERENNTAGRLTLIYFNVCPRIRRQQQNISKKIQYEKRNKLLCPRMMLFLIAETLKMRTIVCVCVYMGF